MKLFMQPSACLLFYLISVNSFKTLIQSIFYPPTYLLATFSTVRKRKRVQFRIGIVLFSHKSVPLHVSVSLSVSLSVHSPLLSHLRCRQNDCTDDDAEIADIEHHISHSFAANAEADVIRHLLFVHPVQGIAAGTAK